MLVSPRAPSDDPDLLGLYDGVALTERYGVAATRMTDFVSGTVAATR